VWTPPSGKKLLYPKRVLRALVMVTLCYGALEIVGLLLLFTTSNYVFFNFNFLAPVVSEIIRGVPNLHYGALRLPDAP